MKRPSSLMRVSTSNVPGVRWPAMTNDQASRILAMLYQLEESQWWPSRTLVQHQSRQMRAVLTHALRTVPFYKESLPAAGFRPDAPLTPEMWNRIPILTRQAIQEAGDSLVSRKIPKSHGRVTKVSTSGSTGRPLIAYGTEVSSFFWKVFTLRLTAWHRTDTRGTLAAIRTYDDGFADYPEGRAMKGWSPAADAIGKTGPAVALSLVTTAPQQAEWLLRRKPDYLISYPSILRALANHCLERGIEIPLKEVHTLSEVVTPELRTLCRQAWGAKLVDMYSTEEVGYIALQCPEHDVYHVQGENIFVEVIDDDGKICGPGEVGRVVVTPLHNFAMPLIRYELTDYVELGEPCPCGRGLPVIKQIMGRTRNLLTLPDGNRIWPRLGHEGDFAEVAPIRQFQLIQTAFDQLEVKLAVARDLTPAEEAAVGKMLLERLGHPLSLTFTYHDEIPKGARGKFEDFKSLISEDDVAARRAAAQA